MPRSDVVDPSSGRLQHAVSLRRIITAAPDDPDALLGGIKVVTERGWFAARPSGTEDVYKLYAESFRGPEHLAEIQEQAREIVAAAIG